MVIFLAVVGMIFVNPSANRTQGSKIGRISKITGYVVFVLLILRGGRFIQRHYYLLDFGVHRVSLYVYKSADLHTSPFL